MILIRRDANGFPVLYKLVSFNEPVAACDIHIRDISEEFIGSGPDQNAVGIALNIILQHLKVDAIFHSNARLTITIHLVVREGTVAGKAQPEAVVGVIRLVSPVDIAFAKYSLEGIVGAIRRVVAFEEIVIASHIDSIGGETGKEKSIASQSCIIVSKEVITRFVNDQKARCIRPQMRPCLAQIVSAAIIGIVVRKGAIASFIEMKTKSAAVICEIVSDMEVFAVIAEDPIHLMLQVIVMNFCICDFV
jgi:hypothetical protein